MGIIIVGSSTGTGAETDSGGNLRIIEGEKGYTAGGEYIASGAPTGVVAAALAANTMLMSARFAAASARKAYVTRFRIALSTVTAGAAAGVPTILGIQRFTAQTPTGGTARTASKKNAVHPSNSDMTDIRDSNAALTGTAPTFGDVVGTNIVPNAGAMVALFEWVWEPDQEPLVLAAGDGIALRTQSLGPATATWMFAYTLHWYEK